MSQDLITNPDYSSLLRPLTTQEYNSLKLSIKENGQYFDITINNRNEVLDGHHRLRICRELGIEPLIRVKNFASPDHEKLFIYECNVRRDLTRYERIVLEIAIQNTKDRINQAKQNSLANLKHGSDVPKLEHRELQGRLVERVAKNTKYGHSTVSKVKKLLDTAPENILRKLSTHKISIDEASNDLKKEQRRKQKQEEAQTYSNSNPNTDDEGKFEVFNDDFKNVHLKANSVNLIFTDPPYEESWLPNYSDLAKLAAITLVPGGSIMTYSNQTQRQQIIRYFENEGFTYCHTIVVILDNTFARNFPRGIVYKYKPLLWFIKGTRREEDSDHISDVIYSKKPTKDDIDWQQSSVEAEHVIARLTRANGKVFDPMMGSGTTGTAAIKLSRKFIGIDMDLKTFQIAKTNIGKFASSGLGLSSSVASKLASILFPIAGKDWRN